MCKAEMILWLSLACLQHSITYRHFLDLLCKGEDVVDFVQQLDRYSSHLPFVDMPTLMFGAQNRLLLGVNIFHVPLDGVDRNVKFGCNLLVRVLSSTQYPDFCLAGR